MKREKHPDGYRTKLAAVRLTENENAVLMKLYEKAKNCNAGLLLSDFMRSQLTFENSDRQLRELLNELRKLRTQLHQALMYSRRFDDKTAEKNLTAAVTEADKKIDEIKQKLEGLYGDNNS